MDALTLAQEIIDGRRITREDDLSFFLTCDLKADAVRKTVNIVPSLHITIPTVKYMTSCRKKILSKPAK